MDDLILKAARFARKAHEGQVRKYVPRPYIEHPMRVAGRATLLEGITAEEIAACWLHDVIEDCDVTADDLRREGFSETTITLVVELTNPSKQHEHEPRVVRKQIDRDHLSQVSRSAKRLKMIDCLDNVRDVIGAKAEFRSLFVAEVVLLMTQLCSADAELAEQVADEIELLGFSREHTDPRTST